MKKTFISVKFFKKSGRKIKEKLDFIKPNCYNA